MTEMLSLHKNPPRVTKIALILKKRLDSRAAEYEEEVRRLADRGFGPASCPHGTNLWVDHDPMCSRCESDEYPYWMTAHLALAEAKSITMQYDEDYYHAGWMVRKTAQLVNKGMATEDELGATYKIINAIDSDYKRRYGQEIFDILITHEEK